MWLLLLGSSCSEEALEPVPNPVWQQLRKPLRRPALSLLHSFLHHRGTRLLQHRQPHRTHEREGLSRRRRLHAEVRQPLRLTANAIGTILPVNTAACSELRDAQDTSPPTKETSEETPRPSPVWSRFPALCHRPFNSTVRELDTTVLVLSFVYDLQLKCFNWTKMQSDNLTKFFWNGWI